MLAVQKKSESANFVARGEPGAAAASDAFANEQVVLILQKILSFSRVNRYIFTSTEIERLMQARERWYAISTGGNVDNDAYPVLELRGVAF